MIVKDLATSVRGSLRTTTSERRALLDVVMLRVLFLVVAWAGFWILRATESSVDFRLAHWVRWDATNLLLVAERGYAPSVAGGNAAAFYPGFPLAVRAVRATSIGLVESGLLVSFAASLVIAVSLHRLAESSGHSGPRSVLALFLFPTAVFLVAPYTEAMFLAAAIPAFLSARGGRSTAAAALVFIAAATRAVGVFVALGVAVELYRRSDRDRKSILAIAGVLAAGAAPTLLYGWHLQRTKGDFFEFLTAQERGWGRRSSDPFSALATSWEALFRPATSDFVVEAGLELLFAGLSVALVVWLFRRREWGYFAYVAGTLALALCSTQYVSVPRIALTFFPFAFVVADFTEDRWRETRIMAGLGAVSMLGVLAFVDGRWYG